MAALDKRLEGITADKFKQASYNPRTITQARLNKLEQSINTFGDLSGVVYNVRTKNLVSGHQRMKTLANAKTRVVQHAHTDELGTIAVGYIEVRNKNGVTKVPYRAVDWNIKREKAANIAANAHGGNFDKEKLALVLADLEDVKFDIDIVGLDPLTLKSLRLPKEGEGVSGGAATRKEFQEFGEDLETQHECPKCKYRW